MRSIALFTHSLQILAFNTESHALICPNKMDSLNENTVTSLKRASHSYPIIMFLTPIGITFFSWPHISLISFPQPLLTFHHLKNSTNMLLIFHL
jgi:hypothetical protein